MCKYSMSYSIGQSKECAYVQVQCVLFNWSKYGVCLCASSKYSMSYSTGQSKECAYVQLYSIGLLIEIYL